MSFERTQNSFKHIFRKPIIRSTLLLGSSLKINSKRGINGSVGVNYGAWILPYYPKGIGLVTQRYHCRPELALCAIIKKITLFCCSCLFKYIINGKDSEGNFWHVAQNPGQHHLGAASWRFSSQAQTPFPHSSKFTQRLPTAPLGQGTSAACLPGMSGSSFDLLFFSPAQSYLISPGRGRGICYLAINS